MLVETFECQETAAEPIEATEEAIRLIGELGLEGQQKLIRKSEEPGEFDKRNPYRLIRADEAFVYSILCPSVVALSQYDAGPIPLRVLQIAAHAQEFYKHLYVMYQPETAEKDPVLIGTDEKKYSYSQEITKKDAILARWGDELESFPVLLKRALEKGREMLCQRARKIVSKVEGATDDELIEHGPNDRYHWW